VTNEKNSKVLEALNKSGVLTEDLFHITPDEAPIHSKELAELKESAKLKETFSDNKEKKRKEIIPPKTEISKE